MEVRFQPLYLGLGWRHYLWYQLALCVSFRLYLDILSVHQYPLWTNYLISYFKMQLVFWTHEFFPLSFVLVKFLLNSCYSVVRIGNLNVFLYFAIKKIHFEDKCKNLNVNQMFGNLIFLKPLYLVYTKLKL